MDENRNCISRRTRAKHSKASSNRQALARLKGQHLGGSYRLFFGADMGTAATAKSRESQGSDSDAIGCSERPHSRTHSTRCAFCACQRRLLASEPPRRQVRCPRVELIGWKRLLACNLHDCRLPQRQTRKHCFLLEDLAWGSVMHKNAVLDKRAHY